jgi:hypothetical protein
MTSIITTTSDTTGPRPRSACPVDWVYCSGACLKTGKEAHNCFGIIPIIVVITSIILIIIPVTLL